MLLANFQVVVHRCCDPRQVYPEDRVIQAAPHRKLSLVPLVIGDKQRDVVGHLLAESRRDQEAAVLLDLGIARDHLELKCPVYQRAILEYDSRSRDRCRRRRWMENPETGETDQTDKCHDVQGVSNPELGTGDDLAPAVQVGVVQGAADDPQLQESELTTAKIRRLVHGGQQQGIQVGECTFDLAGDIQRIPGSAVGQHPASRDE